MNISVTAPVVNLAQLAFAKFRVAKLEVAKPQADDCALERASKSFGDTLITQIKNAVPVYVLWIFLAAGLAMLILSFTGKLNKVGSVVVGTIGAVFLIGSAPTLANIVAPSSCP